LKKDNFLVFFFVFALFLPSSVEVKTLWNTTATY